jgi:hypothetical protein
MIAGLIIIVALMLMMSRWTGAGAAVTVEAFLTLIAALPLPACWLAAALGFGGPMQRWLARDARHPIALQTGLGIACLLILDATLGAIGLLTSQVIAWLVIAIGITLLLLQALPRVRRMREIPLPHAIFWTCAPALAVLVLAACSAPGWLWASEFGGYDALSYHLQLPKEWLARGRIVPLDHNVYSFLPGYVEAAYLHLMSLRGRAATNAMSAVIGCQMLHGLLTILAAGMTGVAAARWCSSPDAQQTVLTSRLLTAMAAALSLATPWVIVVGSLAYNEMAVNLLLAAGLIAAREEGVRPARRGAIVGLLCTAACGAKLTALGFVAAPLGLSLLMSLPRRTWLAAIGSATIAGVVGLLPYLLRNAIHAGNPVFPFATDLLGGAHWTHEQTAIWQRGHMPDVAPLDRLRAVCQQFLAYGFGASPLPAGEPWKPQWGALPWLGVLGAIIALALRAPARRNALVLALIVLVQVLFWLTCTHLKSRFLLPAVVPLCMLVALGESAIRASSPARTSSSRFTIIACIALLALSLLPMRIYRGEGNGSPALAIGTVSQQTGDSLLPSQREDLGSSIFPSIAVNHLLPEDSRVLLVGEAAPLYMRLDRIAYSTVWDRGPLSQLMRDKPDDPEAWRAALRQWNEESAGFTHLLINYTMLDVWERSGWNDPLITRRSVTDFAETACEPLYDYPPPYDITLYRIPD